VPGELTPVVVSFPIGPGRCDEGTFERKPGLLFDRRSAVAPGCLESGGALLGLGRGNVRRQHVWGEGDSVYASGVALGGLSWVANARREQFRVESVRIIDRLNAFYRSHPIFARIGHPADVGRDEGGVGLGRDHGLFHGEDDGDTGGDPGRTQAMERLETRRSGWNFHDHSLAPLLIRPAFLNHSVDVRGKHLREDRPVHDGIDRRDDLAVGTAIVGDDRGVRRHAVEDAVPGESLDRLDVCSVHVEVHTGTAGRRVLEVARPGATAAVQGGGFNTQLAVNYHMTLGENALAVAMDAVVDRVASTLAETGSSFPYFADPETGRWVTTEDGNWCGGHWIGLLWLAADYTDDETQSARFAEAARSHTDTMANYMPRNSMFCGLNFHHAGFDGYDVTGDRSLFALGLAGADATVAAFDERARQVPLGDLDIEGPEQFRGPESDHGPPGDRLGAVDAIHTSLPVLWRAYAETNVPRFRDVAVSHADRHLDWYQRADGSTWHHAVFDAESGDLERQYNELALSDDTCWARGQGWHIAGLARAYAETGAHRYREAIEASVEYHREHASADGVPQWDYRAEQGEPLDTSAAALIAHGLTILPDESATAGLREYGKTLLGTLLEDYLVTERDAPNRGAVLHGCFNRPGRYADDNELLWTNYYVARTIDALRDRQ